MYLLLVGYSQDAKYMAVPLCTDCVKPGIVVYCNGVTRREYAICEKHTLTPDPVANAKNYDWIREMVDERLIAKSLYWEEVLLNGEEWMGDMSNSYQGIMDDEKLMAVLKPKKEHSRGCLHSGEPEVIVSTLSYLSKNGHLGISTGDISTSLYFKRYDGAYRNIRGRQLSRLTA